MTATSQEPATPYPFGVAQRLSVHPKLAEVRQNTPVLRVAMPYGGDAWLATRYEDVKMVLADPRFSRAAVLGKDVPRSTPTIVEDSNILTMDPPEHGRLRKLVAKAFTVRRVELPADRHHHHALTRKALRGWAASCGLPTRSRFSALPAAV